MKTTTMGRPRKAASDKHSAVVPLRLKATEREAFQKCADLSGISLSSWVRERLRLSAIRQLESAGISVPFVQPIETSK